VVAVFNEGLYRVAGQAIFHVKGIAFTDRRAPDVKAILGAKPEVLTAIDKQAIVFVVAVPEPGIRSLVACWWDGHLLVFCMVEKQPVLGGDQQLVFIISHHVRHQAKPLQLRVRLF